MRLAGAGHADLGLILVFPQEQQAVWADDLEGAIDSTKKNGGMILITWFYAAICAADGQGNGKKKRKAKKGKDKPCAVPSAAPDAVFVELCVM